jgi:hypothetical protein
MALPGAQDIITDMRTDPFAHDILNRVETGPYVRRTRIESLHHRLSMHTIRGR